MDRKGAKVKRKIAGNMKETGPESKRILTSLTPSDNLHGTLGEPHLTGWGLRVPGEPDDPNDLNWIMPAEGSGTTSTVFVG